MTDNAKEKLIFALDVDNLDDARRWVEQLHEQVGVFKIGKQLFTKCGPEVVDLVQKGGADVFLDLSAGGILSGEMVAKMADKPIILALANPDPEIKYEDAKAIWDNLGE